MTAQIGELLEYRVQKLVMFTEPLEFYLAYILKEWPKEFHWTHRAGADTLVNGKLKNTSSFWSTSFTIQWIPLIKIL